MNKILINDNYIHVRWVAFKNAQEGSLVAQLVGCWTHNRRVVGSITSDADCFTWDNILGQDVNLAYEGYWFLPCMAILAEVILSKTVWKKP